MTHRDASEQEIAEERSNGIKKELWVKTPCEHQLEETISKHTKNESFLGPSSPRGRSGNSTKTQSGAVNM